MEFIEILLWTVTIVIAIIGIFFSLRAITKMKPVFMKKNNIIVTYNQSFPDLKITYANNPIQNLSSTSIVFWNGGNKRIEKNDIAEMGPLQLIVKTGVKILSVSITKRTKLENAFQVRLSPDQTTIDLTFDYLSKGDGVEILISHTGNSADVLDFIGTIKDVGSPIDLTSKFDKFRNRLADYSILLGTIIALIFMLILMTYTSEQIEKIDSNLRFLLAIGELIVSIIIGVFLAVPIVKYLYKLFVPYPPNFK